MKRHYPSLRRLSLIGVILLILAILALAYIAGRPFADPETKPTIVFDLDAGYPIMTETQNTPFNQTTNEITAYFSSPSDPAAFSIQSYNTTNLTLSQFTGKYLYDNKPTVDILDINFSTGITAINFTFATIELKGGAITVPSDILLTAYDNIRLVGSAKAYGNFSSDSYPQGTLSFGAGQPFNWIRISMPSQTSATTDFLIDNIKVTVASSSKP